MAEDNTVIVTDNVQLQVDKKEGWFKSLSEAASNLQGKVGATLLGTKLATPASKLGIGEKSIGVLDRIRDLQVTAVTHLSEIADILRQQLGFEKQQDREAFEQKGDKLGKKGGPKSDLQQLSEWFKGLDTGGLKGMGIGAGIAGLTGMLGKAIFSRMTGLIAGVTWAIFDGLTGSKLWGGVPGFIGGLLGGLNSGVRGMFLGAGKWALIGATLGSVIPGLGTLVGGVFGALFGGFMGWFGGERITGWINNIIEFPKKMIEGIKTFFSDLQDSVAKLTLGVVDKFKEITSMIFDPIIRTAKRMINAVKSALNAIIDKIPFMSDEWKEGKKFDITPVGSPEEEKATETVQDLKEQTTSITDKIDKKQKVKSEDVEKTLSASDNMLATMDSEGLKQETKHAKFVMDTVQKTIGDLQTIADSGEVSEADKKKLNAKASELYKKMKLNTMNWESEKKKTILADDHSIIDKQDAGVEGAYDSQTVQADLDDLKLSKIASEEKIALLEAKLEKDGKLSQGDYQSLGMEKSKLALTNEDIAKINNYLGEILTAQYDIDLEKLKIEPETPKLAIEKRGLNQRFKRLTLAEKAKEMVGNMTNIGGSPSINTNKNISAIVTRTAYPVDATLAASLNGYKA